MNSQEQTQQVYVVGSQQLQNALLTEFLVKEDVATKSIPSVEGVSVETLHGIRPEPVSGGLPQR